MPHLPEESVFAVSRGSRHPHDVVSDVVLDHVQHLVSAVGGNGTQEQRRVAGLAFPCG